MLIVFSNPVALDISELYFGILLQRFEWIIIAGRVYKELW